MSSIHRMASIAKHRCGAPVLVGLDDDVAAFSVAADVYALSNLGEVEALRSGRWSYRLDMKRLHRRDKYDIRRHPAAHAVVLTEHRCHEPVPAEWRKPLQRKANPAPKGSDDVEF